MKYEKRKKNFAVFLVLAVAVNLLFQGSLGVFAQSKPSKDAEETSVKNERVVDVDDLESKKVKDSKTNETIGISKNPGAIKKVDGNLEKNEINEKRQSEDEKNLKTDKPKVKDRKENDEKSKLPEEKKAKKLNEAPIVGSQIANGLTVFVVAPKGSFPEGTVLHIKPLSGSNAASLIKSVSKNMIAEGFDISFTNKDGKNVQPKEGTDVDVKFVAQGSSSLGQQKEGSNKESKELSVYHVQGKSSVKKMGTFAVPRKDSFSQTIVKASGFSPYIVAKGGGNVITSASIAKIDGSPMTGTIAAWQAFRINVNYKLPNNTFHEGDTTTITLPAGIVPASPSTFQIKDGSDVVANGKLVDGNPTKVILTYTKYVEEKSDLQGKFLFNAQIDNKVHNTEKTIPVNLAVNGETVYAGELHYKPKTIELLPILKAGWMWSQDSTVGIYQIKINQKNEAFVNAKVVDELLNPGVSYIQGSLKVYEGKWELNYGGTGLELMNKKDVTEHYKDKITYDGSKFTFDIGNAPAGKGLLLEYRVKIPYKPIAGEKFKNKATFTNNGQNYNHGVTYQIIEAGGSGEGYTYSIEINKMNPAGSPLKGATFDIIRVRSGKTVGTVETDANGYAKIGGLLHDNYKIHETKAPEGYDLASDMDVSSSDFDPVTKTAKKTIIDKEKTISVSVEKKWDDANNQDGKRPGFIKVQLYGDEEKVGPEETLNEGNGWAKEWTGLPEKKAGKKIKYTVKEVGSTAGYTTTTEEKTPGSFVIINKHTPETIKIEGKKTWKDNENQDGVRPDQITIRLFADGTEVDSKTVTADDNWQWSFKDLPKFKEGKEIVYTIAEDAVKDYTSKVEKFDVINTHAPGKTGINVTKKWDDKNDKDKIRPGKVTIRLYADGKDTGKSLELSKSNNWTGSFSDLDEKKDGKIIKYTVKEDKVDKYTAAITGNAKKGYVVTNTHNPTNKPLKPPQGENKEPKTGDNTNLVGTLGVLIVSLLVIAGIAYKRKKNNN